MVDSLDTNGDETKKCFLNHQRYGQALGCLLPPPVKCTVVSQPGHFTPFAPESQGIIDEDLFPDAENEKEMNETKSNRSKWLHIRLTEAELKKLQFGFSNSTKCKMSEYARSILLNKPITVYTRNQSFDDFMAEMILLRAELKAIGNNFNQLVKKLHIMDNSAEINAWALLNETSKRLFFKKAEEINLKIAQIADKWLQE